jgi:signal transduction histidine kinase
MIKISEQLRKYFVTISILSIAFIAITSNVSINFFFSGYIRESRRSDDQRVVQYVERVYGDYEELNEQSLMNILHYALSEDVIIAIKDLNSNAVWNSSTSSIMYGMAEDNYSSDENNFAFRAYPFIYKDIQVGTIEIGRPKSIISNIEDEHFLITINSVFVIASIFTLLIALNSSSRLSKKFLNPIYDIKENAKKIEDGKYTELSEVNTNTFELHDLSVSVEELAERLYNQEALRKRMTTDIAHELRTPVAAIQSHIEAFMDGVWEPDMQKLSIVHGEIKRLTKLINELSDLSIIESDKVKVNLTNADISAILVTVIESFEPMFIGKNISLKKDIQDSVKMIGDPESLKKIFTNVLSNAYKYTNENGTVDVALKTINEKIIVEIKDTGIGIPKEDIKYVFERFYRSDLSRSRKTGGTGIGLTITKALVEANGGTIGIESEEGKGTKVAIDFKG